MHATKTNPRVIEVLNRNEFAMSREDDFAQVAAVRNYIERGTATETELFRLSINASEPFRTIDYNMDAEDMAALASQSTKQAFWVGYADGQIIHRAPAGYGAYRQVADALAGYVATQRLIAGREPEAVTMDKVSAYHFADLPEPPLSNPCGALDANPYDDRLPRSVAWIDGDATEDSHLLPYIEGVSESAMEGGRAIAPAPSCE